MKIDGASLKKKIIIETQVLELSMNKKITSAKKIHAFFTGFLSCNTSFSKLDADILLIADLQILSALILKAHCHSTILNKIFTSIFVNMNFFTAVYNHFCLQYYARSFEIAKLIQI